MSRQGLLGLLSLIAVGGCASPLTGLQCAEGYSQCGGECVDTDSDLMHCGSCDMACPASGWVCIGGQCGRELPGGGVDFDASVPDAGEVPDATVDGGDGGPTRPLPEPDKPLCDGTIPADECRCGIGTLKCGNECVDPTSDVEHCGGCGQACATDQFCAVGMCVDDCEAPFAQCGNLCVNVDENAGNCGECGNRCATSICNEGTCSGRAAGHVVLIGHDYRGTSPSQNEVAAGAVLLSNKGNPRILAYRAFTDDRIREGIDAVLERTLSLDPSTIEEAVLPALSLQLSNADVLLIYPQTEVSQADLMGKVRTGFEGVLPSFLGTGGVVVVFEGRGPHGGTFQLVTVDGLVDVTGRSPVSSGEIVQTVTGFIGFTSGIETPYLLKRNTFEFEGVPVTSPAVLMYQTERESPIVLDYVFSP